MNEQFETQNPVENTVTPANQMETPTPEALKRKETKSPSLRAWWQQWLSRRRWRICSGQNRSFFKPVKKSTARRCKDRE